MDHEQKKNEFVTASFHTRKEYVSMLRDYAYSERLSIKEVLDMALSDFFKEHKPRLHKEALKRR